MAPSSARSSRRAARAGSCPRRSSRGRGWRRSWNDAALAFGLRRSRTRRGRGCGGAGYVLAGGSNLAELLFSDGKSTCGSNCPTNVLLVYHDETIATAIQAIVAVGVAFIAVTLVALLARRWHGATPALRRALLPVFVAGGFTLLAIAVDVAAGVVGRLESPAYWTLLAFFLTVPLAFLLGLLRSRLAG